MKKKFGFFCLHFEPPIGGAEMSMRKYFESISKYLDIEVFCFLDSNGKQFNSTKIIEKNGIKITCSAEPIQKVVLKYISLKKPNFIGTQLLWSDPVVELAKKSSIPCYYFAHGLFEDICQFYLTNKCQFNSLVNCSFGDSCPNGTGLKNSLYKYMSCEKIFCNSIFTKSIFNRFFPDLKNFNKIDLLYPFIDSNVFKYKEKEKYRINKNNILAINSNFTKGRDVICKIANDMDNYNFTIIDVKEQDKKYFDGIKNIKLVDKVSINEMVDYYQKSDVVIIPTFMDETFSMVACESILCGTPVVSSRKGNLPNIIINGLTGFVVDTYDVWDWKSSIENACSIEIKKEVSEGYANSYNFKNGIDILKKEFQLDNKNIEKNIEKNFNEVFFKFFGKNWID